MSDTCLICGKPTPKPAPNLCPAYCRVVSVETLAYCRTTLPRVISSTDVMVGDVISYTSSFYGLIDQALVTCVNGAGFRAKILLCRAPTYKDQLESGYSDISGNNFSQVSSIVLLMPFTALKVTPRVGKSLEQICKEITAIIAKYE